MLITCAERVKAIAMETLTVKWDLFVETITVGPVSSQEPTAVKPMYQHVSTLPVYKLYKTRNDSSMSTTVSVNPLQPAMQTTLLGTAAPMIMFAKLMRVTVTLTPIAKEPWFVAKTTVEMLFLEEQIVALIGVSNIILSTVKRGFILNCFRQAHGSTTTGDAVHQVHPAMLGWEIATLMQTAFQA